MRIFLKCLAPYLAVIPFCVLSQNAWAAMLTYHAQCLFWSGRHLPNVLSGWNWKRWIGLSIPFACAGPLAFLLLPMMLKDITPIQWLQDYGVTRATTIPLIFYFGLIHPPLEQAHWSRLRQATPWAHFAFAGYHGLVLYDLFSWPWLLLSLAVLAGTSGLWGIIEKKSNGLCMVTLSHILADTGIAVAAISIGNPLN